MLLLQRKLYNIGPLCKAYQLGSGVVSSLLLFSLNSLSVRVYGESEYWFALIKVVTVIIFIGIGILTILGIMGGEFVGFDTLQKEMGQY